MTEKFQSPTVSVDTAELDALYAFCLKLAKSDAPILPDAYRPSRSQSAEQAAGKLFAVVTMGRECGLSPWGAIQGLYSPAPGRVGFQSSTLVALLRRAGYRIEWLESTDKLAKIKLWAPAPSTDYHVEEFSIERATAMKTWVKGSDDKKVQVPLAEKWRRNGMDARGMLRYRAIAAACRVFAADVFTFTAYTVDEVEDIVDANDRATVKVDGAAPSRADALADSLGLPAEPEPEPSPEADLAATWRERIEAAQSMDDLAVVGQEIRAMAPTLAPEVREGLQRAYAARGNALVAGKA